MAKARTLVTRYEGLQAQLAKLHRDAQAALQAGRMSAEDAISVHVVAKLTEAVHQLHVSRQGAL